VHISPEVLIDVLRDQGLRVTNARRSVCAVIARNHGEHLTAASILEEVQADPDANADQSTVYRTLDALEEAGMLTHSHLGHGAAVYHLASESAHQHVVCSNCGATASVPTEGLSTWLEDLRQATGYQVDPTHFAVTGLCTDCAKRP
jgi:Fur family ferric uptake transcriptional regulator